MEAILEIVDSNKIVESISENSIPDNIIRIVKIKNGYGIFTRNKEHTEKFKIFLEPSYQIGNEAYFIIEGESVTPSSISKLVASL